MSRKMDAALKESYFPARDDEAWKYTNLNNISYEDLQPSEVQQATDLKITSGLKESYKIIFTDGVFAAEKSNLPNCLKFISEVKKSEIIQNILESSEKFNEQKHVKLSDSFSKDALLIHLKKGEVLDSPIEIHNITTKNAQSSSYTNIFVLQEEGSILTLLEKFYGEQNIAELRYIQHNVLRVKLEASANLAHYRVQNLPTDIHHLYNANLDLKTASEYNSFSFQKGALLSRQEVQANLNGENIKCDQQGITFGKQKQHHDNYLPVFHNQPNSYSNQHFRQLLDDDSKGIFYGRVDVPHDSIKTEAHQLNKNLLLSDRAEAFTRPELNIFTDDVVCSHGATIGNLDEEALYYLQSRGLKQDLAQEMLIESFVFEILEKVKNKEIKELMFLEIKN